MITLSAVQIARLNALPIAQLGLPSAAERERRRRTEFDLNDFPEAVAVALASRTSRHAVVYC